MMTAFQRPPKPLDLQPEADPLPAYNVREIMQDGGQVRLVLDGQNYVLRITRAGKLILTK